MSFHIMKSYTIKLQKPGTKLEKKNQLAWLIANMAAEDWSLTKEISDMVGNRIIDNAGVAIAALNNKAVKIARAQAMKFENNSGSTLFGLDQNKKYDCQWAAWANAVAVRELDFHDNIMAKETCHPGDCIPTILAVAQQKKVNGISLIKGILTAYEVQVNLVKGICLHKHKIDHIAHLGPSVAAGIGTMLKLKTEIIPHFRSNNRI